MTFENKDITKEEWGIFLSKQPQANFLYSWQWGELHEKLGNVVVRKGVYSDDHLIGVVFGIVRNAKRGRYIEIPGGPLIDWKKKSLAGYVTEMLKSIAKSNKAVFVRIRPQVEESEAMHDMLHSFGFKKSPMHLHSEHTSILDIVDSEEILLERMRQQTRYEIKRSAKQGVVVSSSSSREAMAKFIDVQLDTAKRQGFIPSSSEFLLQLGEVFADNLQIYKAEKDGELLNLAVVIFYGEEADYYEAASTAAGRKYGGSYAIQWQAIKDARKRGMKRYNFWGIAYNNDPNHRYAGVTTFKRGFGGDDVTYIPAHDLIINHAKYSTNWLIETVRRKKRKL